MDFLFSPEVDPDCLRQGDLLLKTKKLRAAVNKAHNFYAKADDYTHFVVLTQSCDLVRRNGKCNAKYITLAAVRPLKTLIDRSIDKYRDRDIEFPVNVCYKDRKAEIDRLLERLLHNTEDTYFFIRRDSAESVSVDLVAFLVLSIALRIEHYDACLSAKKAQLTDIFAAKLGWLTGNLYSRVATPDLEEHMGDGAAEYKSEFFDETISAAWLSPAQIRELKRLVRAWKKDNQDKELTTEIAWELLDQVPDDIELVARRAVEILGFSDLIDKSEGVSDRARNALKNDTNFQRIVRSAS